MKEGEEASEEGGSNSDSSDPAGNGLDEMTEQIHSELDSVSQVLTSMSDDDSAPKADAQTGPAIQSIVQTLVGCTEKYLGDSVKFEPN